MDEWRVEARRKATEDVAFGEFLALRHLRSPDGKADERVGLLGPYPSDQSRNDVAYFTYVESGGVSKLVVAEGDAFQALNLGIETCRMYVVIALQKHDFNLIDDNGDRYTGYDLPENPSQRPLFGR